MIPTDQRIEQRFEQLPSKSTSVKVRQNIERINLAGIVEAAKSVASTTPESDDAIRVFEDENLLVG